MVFPSIRVEGGLIPADLIDQIATGNAEGQTAADFHLRSGARLSDEIAAAWADARAYWHAFQRALDRLPDDDPATTPTRQLWIVPLLYALGYEQVTFMRTAEVLDGRTYAISHRAGESETAPPIHIEGARTSLDQRPPSGRPRLSPHGLLQEYLNHSEHVWGIVTNGLQLRLIRDSALMSRLSYVEFDLHAMLEGEHFADFGVLYRLLHRTRLPAGIDDAPRCLLERYYQHGVEQGGRVREHLRDGVEAALVALGNGFLAHPKSADLRRKVEQGAITPIEFYGQLLRLIYRFLFLLVSEERGLIGPHDAQLRKIYDENYSISRLRKLVEIRLSTAGRYHDLWLGLARTTFRIHEDADIAAKLGMGALNGYLFGPGAIPDLRDATISNADLLRALRHLMLWHDGKMLRRVNYAALDVEELGSVYESLLDFHPTITQTDRGPVFALATGTERKTTGSYYTRPELVQELIKSALDPVIADRLKAAGTDRDARERALLSLTVCDPACGSGHFLLAAARRIGHELAVVRTGEAHPAPEATRAAIRDAIRHCIYGVDKNPLAVDLCKVALWLEGHNHDRPLSFLDHRIKCGDSLVGVFNLDVLREGIPDGAYTAVSGDEKKTATAIRNENRQEREGQLELFGAPRIPNVDSLALLLADFAREHEDTPEDVRRKASAYEQTRARGTTWWHLTTACHLWTAAFFTPLTPATRHLVPTTETIRQHLTTNSASGDIIGHAHQLASDNRFFHWPLEFPEVFERGGFDVVLGNPPWERIKLQEQEFFAASDVAIATAPNKAARQRLINALPQTNPALAREFAQAKYSAEASSRFMRGGERYERTARGDINTYSVFAELFSRLLNPRGAAGMIVPTGIATDDTNKVFFGYLVESQRLGSLLDFENRDAIFPGVDRRYKFSLITLRGSKGAAEGAEFVFFATNIEHLRDPQRRFTLTAADFARINPNTRTAPIFRTRADADLAREVYKRVPVLVNESSGTNPWGVSFLRMLDMSNDSNLFHTEPGDALVPLYEAKLMHQFDHRFATYTPDGSTRNLTPDEKADPNCAPVPRYWVAEREVHAKLGDWRRGWLLGFRDITNATNERTAIFSLLPRVGVGHKAPLVFLENAERTQEVTCFLANANSLIFDYVLRQKIGGTSLSYFILKQLPTLPPHAYSPADVDFIAPRVLELVYTAWDMQPFARDMGYDGPPFVWDEERRALLRAELDAYYAHLYGLTRDELRYILDPADVYGEDFPGETFRVLKEKEIKRHGEYRTRRLVLEAWDRLFLRAERVP